MKGEKHLIYQGGRLPDPGLNIVTYTPEFFNKELDLESEVFYELRRSNDVQPYRINQSSSRDLEEIKTFFSNNRNNFFFLFDKDNLIGSILLLKNYIQSLSIATGYQSKGYGTKLTTYAINRILDKGYSSVELNILPGNIAAEHLYRKLGFVEVPDQ
ncbi:MAG: GNAT family N-acetyltransferase [Spirochaetes bacterium]|nr:GNAT family N-acetyltransferase [Spirochaetota bacterium]